MQKNRTLAVPAWLKLLLLAALYVGLAQFGFLFAIAPGNITFLWLPSGLAVASLVLLGRRAMWGIGLGSFVANLLQLLMMGLADVWATVFLCAMIALGSSLQALVAHYFIQRGLRPDAEGYFSVYTFKGLAGMALACLVAASVGVTTLFFLQQVSAEHYLFAWSTWWLGDWLGIVTSLPLFMALGRQGIGKPWHKFTPPATISLGLMATLALFAVSWTLETRAVAAQFEVEAHILRSSLEKNLQLTRNDLDSVEGFLMASSLETSRAAFQTFTQHLLEDEHFSRGLQALSWNPYVQADQRAPLEAAIRNEGFPDFKFTERNAEGQLVPAAERSSYVIVQYIEPLPGNEQALGFDVSSNPIRLAAIQQARDAGETTITAPILLVQDTEKHPGFLVFHPIYQPGLPLTTLPERRTALAGFAVAVIRVDILLEASQAVLPAHYNEIYLFDLGMPEGTQLLYFRPVALLSQPVELASTIAPADITTGIYYSTEIAFAKRRWQMVIVPTPNAIQQRRSGIPFGVGLAGLIITALAAAYVYNRQQAELALRNSETTTRLIIDTAPDSIVAVNQNSQIVLANHQTEVVFGYPTSELLGLTIEALLPQRFHEQHREHRLAYQKAPQARQMGLNLQLYGLRKNREEFPVDIMLSPLQTTQELLFMATIRDLSAQAQAAAEIRQLNATLEQRVVERTAALEKEILERTRIEKALQQSYRQLEGSMAELERHNQEVTLLSELVEMLEACRTAQEAHQVISLHLPRLFAVDAGALYMFSETNKLLESVAQWGRAPTLTLAPAFAKADCWALRRGRLHQAGAAQANIVCDHVALGASLPPFYLCAPMVAHGETLGVLYLQWNVAGNDESETQTNQQLASTVADQLALVLANLRLRETLRDQSVRDPLTGLYNRRYMEETLERELRQSERHHQSLVVAILDLDYFKRLNDTFGHAAGDIVLVEFGKLLKHNMRVGDVVCRYGGEEFVVILLNITSTNAQKRLEKIREALKHLELEHNGHLLNGLTVSIGLAISTTHGKSSSTLLKAADAALYAAKEAGRDRVVCAPVGADDYAAGAKTN